MQSLLRTPRTFRQSNRLFHASVTRAHLVGPPDPVSNIRPIIYDNVSHSPSNMHPYSLREFGGDTREYQWKMQRQELDAFNHTFWADSNSRFEAGKRAVFQSLPDSSSTEDHERALSDYYRSWVAQEGPRQREYSAQWRRRNWTSIWLGARVQYEKLMSRLSSGGGGQSR